MGCDMKQPDEMTYDELENYRDFAEAEYCPKCGGSGFVPKQCAVLELHAGKITVAPFRSYGVETCDRCKGTGRA